jgi:hypothetical protein
MRSLHLHPYSTYKVKIDNYIQFKKINQINNETQNNKNSAFAK